MFADRLVVSTPCNKFVSEWFLFRSIGQKTITITAIVSLQNQQKDVTSSSLLYNQVISHGERFVVISDFLFFPFLFDDSTGNSVVIL